ncbi:MAG: glycosyltransferase [Candidatus Micrarchaeota archaeon]
MFSVILPTFNEENRVSVVLNELAFALKKKDCDVIIVDDSTDSTVDVVNSFKKRFKKLRVLHSNERKGKGNAIIRGFKASKSSKALVMDADSSVSVEQALSLLDFLSEADVVISSRYLKDSYRSVPFNRWFVSRCFNLLVRLLFGLNYFDTQCGYKAFNKKAMQIIAKESESKGFVWDVEMLLIARKHGLQVKEVPVVWSHVSGGAPEVHLFRTAWKMLSDLFSLKNRF